MSTFRKIAGMAVLAALGATVGAGAGERLFAGQPPGQPEQRSICLLFDTSGSMRKPIDPRDPNRSQLLALQEAAATFVAGPEAADDQIGLVSFASEARVHTAPSRDRTSLQRAISGLQAHGFTDLAGGLAAAGTQLESATGERWVLLFSDGRPRTADDQGDAVVTALDAAERTRRAGIHIVAIGTGLADRELLTEITGRAENVILSDPERLQEAFRRSREVIDSRQMLARSPGRIDFEDSVTRAGLWAALIAVGAGLAMVLAQNRHLRRHLLSLRETLLVLVGGALTGAIAGAAGQSLFFLVSQFRWLQDAGRSVAWIVLGLGIGIGMTLFVPNLHRRRAAFGGLLGGLVAAMLFVFAVPALGDTIGRLASAAALGLFTAIAVILLEAASCEAWLVVHFSPKERSTLRLGDRPILVGHSSIAHIRPSSKNGEPIVARFEFDDHHVLYHDVRFGGKRRLQDGERITFGRIEVEVRLAERTDDAATPAPAIAIGKPAAAASAPQPTTAPKPTAAPNPTGPAKQTGRAREGQSLPGARAPQPAGTVKLPWE